MAEVERDLALRFTASLGVPALEGVSTTVGLGLGFGTSLARALGGCFGLAG